MNTATDYQIVPVSALGDNYIWLLRQGDQAAVVDPGDAAPVLDYLHQHKLSLCAILATHHHADHIGGIEALCAGHATPVPVYGPAGESIAALTHPLKPNQSITLPMLGAAFEIIGVPGHTRAHIAYYDRNHAACGSLFCGDALFACGCGRIFEGTPMLMRHSLARLAALPDATRIYCAHEYTQANIRFALAVDPDNPTLRARAAEVAKLRAANLPSLPTTLKLELATNPFLRWNAPAIIQAAQSHGGTPVVHANDVFAVIRAWKDTF